MYVGQSEENIREGENRLQMFSDYLSQGFLKVQFVLIKGIPRHLITI